LQRATGAALRLNLAALVDRMDHRLLAINILACFQASMVMRWCHGRSRDDYREVLARKISSLSSSRSGPLAPALSPSSLGSKDVLLREADDPFDRRKAAMIEAQRRTGRTLQNLAARRQLTGLSEAKELLRRARSAS